MLARLREETRGRELAVGLTPGFGRVLALMPATPSPAARLGDLAGQPVDELAVLLAAETGAAPIVDGKSGTTNLAPHLGDRPPSSVEVWC